MTKRTGAVRKLAAASAAILLSQLPAGTSAADPDRPHAGRCSTVVTPVSQNGPVQELHIASDCNLTHLGRATGQTTQFVTPIGPPAPTVPLLITNTTEYRAANGDRLMMSFLGTGQLDLSTGEVSFVGSETFQGGTGRFANASGSATIQGRASVATNLGSFTTSGRIAY